jgi:acetolactate synthase-1/2/3 large subunit
MAMLSGGQLVAKMLKAEGVSHIFSLSGLHIAPIYAGCVEEGIQVVDTRHEQAAAHAADGWARLTRQLGVAVVTAGPGVTDALTGVANAYSASSPMLLIGGAAPNFNAGRGSLQEMEQVDLFTRITKYADRVPSPDRIPIYLAKAARIALTGRPGPVFLEIPWDVLSNAVDENEAPIQSMYRTRARTAGDPEYVQKAIDLIQNAEKVAVIAGSSVWWDDAAAELAQFAELAGVPVFLNGSGRGALPYDHPNFFQNTRKQALSEADVVLVLGTPFDFRLSYGQAPTFGDTIKIIQVDTDPQEVARNRSVDVGIVGDTKLVLKQLIGGLSKRDGSAFLKELRARENKAKEKQAVFENSDQKPIHHYRLAKAIDTVAHADGRDPIFIGDGGNYVAIAAKVLRLQGPGRWLDPGPLGCLGVGAPFAIAAKILHPDKPVFVIQGDGSFGFNGMDFETAVRFKLPMVCVVGNDAAWGQIRIPQIQFHGEDKSPATLLAPTRYDKIVEGMGGYGELVTDPDQLIPALERAVKSNTVACVNVMIDPDAPAASGSIGYAV